MNLRVVAAALTLGGVLLLVQLMFARQAFAESELSRFLPGIDPRELFAEATRLGEAEGEPPVVAVFRDKEQLGFVYLTSDYVNTTGYSGKPIHQLVAIDLAAVIRKVLLVKHHEPIVLIGIPEKRIVAVLDNYVGLDIGKMVRGELGAPKVDVVTGATVTVMVMDDNIRRSAIQVARAHRLGGLTPKRKHSGPTASVNPAITGVESWQTLLDDSSVAVLKLTLGQVNSAFEESGDEQAARVPEEGPQDEVFIELYAAVVSIPVIGRSLLGEAEYTNLLKRLEPGQHAIILAGDGRYSFKGSGYVRGGIFDRFQLVQGDNLIRLHDYEHKRLGRIAAEGAPKLKDVDLFILPTDQGFDGALPWQLELLVGRLTGPTRKSFLNFELLYTPPSKYLNFTEPEVVPSPGFIAWLEAEAAAEDAPLWKRMWLNKLPQVAVLLAALGVLTLIFFFQNWLVRRPVLTDRVRVGFLVFTLFGIGWYANAQLSVVNILAVLNAVVSGFDWSYFLMEPLIFVLWGSVATSLLFWGRGAFCGWLCPFGALQELMNRLAKFVKIPQVSLPWGLHERLWALKYLIFLALFGLSLHSLEWAERLAEVEPFKTAIILKFQRGWPYVLFALGMLLPGLFIERFYCRYLCPLGAALAIPGRLRMFEWLKRYKECGTPCQRCSQECMVQAIHKEGNINVNECLYCLHCQVVYVDEHACPVLIQKRLKRERPSRQTAENKSGAAKRLESVKAKVREAADIIAVSE
jgi:NosR/NirI family nitrous oxide reductase transcriptional regulator